MVKFERDNAFAERFRRLVAEKFAATKKISQAELGKKLGVSTTCAHFYLNGERLPSMDNARDLARTFNVCVEWFLTGRGPMRPVNNSNYIDLSVLTDQQRQILTMMAESFKTQKHEEPEPKETNRRSKTDRRKGCQTH
jgi:DNA-binding XRE family transcriptional regulator